MTDWTYNEIIRIVTDCESVQKDHGSEYTKKMAKISAYDEIREVLGNEIRVKDDE
jgi:hypothetical protein